MTRFFSQLIPALLLLVGTASAELTTLYVDFGNSWLKTPAPDALGHYWTNATHEVIQIPGLFNLVAADGRGTGAFLKLTGNIEFNPWGANASAWGTENPDSATLGSLAISSATWDWLTVTGNQAATVTISKLPPEGLYRLSLFASRDNFQRRVTEYTVSSLTTDTRQLQTSGTGIGIDPQPNANRSGLAVFENLAPTADGTLIITVRRKEGDAGYLGALRLELMTPANFAPAATEVRTAGSGRVGAPQIGRYVFSDRDNDPEGASTCFWEKAASATAIPAKVSEAGPGTLTYIPTAEDQGTYLRFGVVPRAANGFIQGNVIYSDWVGPIAAAGTFTSFHIGSSYTQWANMPQQLKNLSASRGVPIITGWQVTSGRDSQYHWGNGLNGTIGAGTYSRYELQSGSWDAVILQPYNTEWQLWQINQILDYGKRFYSLADSYGSQFYLYSAWPARGQSLATQTDINAAFERIRSTISVGGNKAALVIPAGEAFRAVIQEAATGYLKSFNVNNNLDRSNLYLDDLHQTNLGAYVSALTHYATVMKRTPVGLPAQGLDAYFLNDNSVTFNPALATRIQEIVWWVVANYPNSGVVASVAKPAEIIIPPEPEYPPPVFVTLSGAPSDPTLLKLAFGPSSDGFNAPAQNLPHSVASATEGNFTIQYTVNPAAEADGVTFTPHWSDDLSRWTLTQPASAVITRVNNTVTVTWSMASRWRFFRVFVSKP